MCSAPSPFKHLRKAAFRSLPEALVHAVLSNDAMWGEDLTQIPGFEDGVLQALRMVQKDGAYAAMKV